MRKKLKNGDNRTVLKGTCVEEEEDEKEKRRKESQ
jgi:hypothetical protein